MKRSQPSFACCAIAALTTALAAYAQAQQPAALATATTSSGGALVLSEQALGGLQGRAATAESQQAENLVLEVRDSIVAADSIECSTRHRIGLFESQKMILGAGHYYQLGHGLRRLIRSERRSQLGNRTDISFEICDGTYFWTYRGSSSVGTLTQVNLQRVAQAWDEMRHAKPMTSNREPAVGGLPRLLDALVENFQFERISAGRLGNRPVWIVEGNWKPDKLAAAIPDQKAKIEAGNAVDPNRFPAQLPERVVLEIAQENPRLFPCRLEYLRHVGGSASEQGRGGDGGASLGFRTIVAIEWFDIKINQPIDPQEFVYQPSGQAADATDQCLRELNLLPSSQK